jgi:hypothetical protein
MRDAATSPCKGSVPQCAHGYLNLEIKGSDMNKKGKERHLFSNKTVGLLACPFLLMILSALPAMAALPKPTIEYQPMSSDGLAAGLPFESWVVFDMSSNPTVLGLALPAGATFRFTFSAEFSPQSGQPPKAVLLHNWPQKPIMIPFSVKLDPNDHRIIVVKLEAPIPVETPERPGLKSIHLQWGPLNPNVSGDYAVKVELTDAGEFSGAAEAVARITTRPVPNIAAYNQLHQGQNENWQHVKVGQTAPMPIDLLITLPDTNRCFMTLCPQEGGDLDILSDGKLIGTIIRKGVPVSLKPEPLGPGFARLGIVRYHVTAGTEPGNAEMVANLQNGTSYTITVIVEP